VRPSASSRGSPGFYNDLGVALDRQGALDEAFAALKEAIRLQPDFAQAFRNLGVVLHRKGASDEGIVALKKAILLRPDFADAYYNLGKTFQDNGVLDEAITAYKETIRIKPDYAEAFCNLGGALEKNGQFTEALAARRRGHELGSKDPHWPYPSARWVQDCERLVDLDARLPAILRGESVPAGPAERTEFAQLCALKQLNAAGARLYQEAFAAKPELANNLARIAHRRWLR
jgi:tetratricopeptide (TPR) repeat protein